MRYLLILALLPINVFAAAFSISGDWRSEVAMYHDISLDKNNPGLVSNDYATGSNGAALEPNAVDRSKTYWLQRFKIKPDLVVYDNVRVNSEWILMAGSPLTSTLMGGAANNLTTGNIMGGDNINANLSIRRVWLDWTSDWGVFRMGRMPTNFGLGMVSNSGDGLWDYFGSTVDRISYDLVAGDLIFGLAYDITAEGAVNYTADDRSAFRTQISYSEPESSMEIAFRWLMDFGRSNYKLHTYNVYQKKTFTASEITLGWEAAYQKGDMLGKTVQAFGLLGEFNWHPSKAELGFKLGLATGDKGDDPNKDYAFRYNRNYKIAMLMFNEDLGVAADSVHGSQGIGADFNNQGAVFFAPNFKWMFIENLWWGTTFAYAVVQKAVPGRNKYIGFEWDTDFTYFWKENLETGLRFGAFFPGSYFTSRATAIGLMATVGLKF
jgi:hypothetical protein